MTARSLTDRFKSLWLSVVVEALSSSRTRKDTDARLWFSGDTAYSTTAHPPKTGANELMPDPERPVCPAFEEIGEKFEGGFDLALIGIGAYQPRFSSLW